MENLENSEVILLNKEESKELNGGFAILPSIAIGLAIAAGAEILGDWDNFKRGLVGVPEVR